MAGFVLPDVPSPLFTLFSSLGSMGGDQREEGEWGLLGRCLYPVGLPVAAHIIHRKVLILSSLQTWLDLLFICISFLELPQVSLAQVTEFVVTRLWVQSLKSRCCEGKSVSSFSFLVLGLFSLFTGAIVLVALTLSSVCTCELCVQVSPFYKDTRHIGVLPTLTTSS